MEVTSCDISSTNNSSGERTTHNPRNDIGDVEIVKKNPNEPKRPNFKPQESST